MILRIACLCTCLTMTACAATKAPTPTLNTESNSTLNTHLSDTGTTAAATDTNPAPTTQSTLSGVLSTQGFISDNRMNEISGLAASNYHSGILWALNDSGNDSILFRLNTDASLIDAWNVGVKNRDWEAMASVVINGASYLLIAETGDNLQVHQESHIHVVQEPDSSAAATTILTPITTLRYQYEGGPHNVEAMAVSGNDILLLTKERLVRGKSVPSKVFRLPLTLQSPNQALIASHIGDLTLPKRGFNIGLLTRLLNIDPMQPTDMSISADGKNAYVLNYVHVLHYARDNNESWSSAFAKRPKIVSQHGLRQAEALTVNALGEVWLTSEKRGAPLMGFKAFDPSPLFN